MVPARAQCTTSRSQSPPLKSAGRPQGVRAQISGRPAVGSYIAKNDTSFDTRLYGSAKLSKQTYLEVKETVDAASFTHLAIRLRP